jgi:hypothetical protein
VTRNVSIGLPHRPEDPSATDFTLSETAIREDVPDRKAEAREHFVADWGIRVTDNALVIHLFPPLDDTGSLSEEWEAGYQMDKRLDRAMPAVFDVSNLTAGFEPMYNSFYIIVGSGGLTFDPRLLVRRFLDAIEEPLR